MNSGTGRVIDINDNLFLTTLIVETLNLDLTPTGRADSGMSLTQIGMYFLLEAKQEQAYSCRSFTGPYSGLVDYVCVT